MARIAWIKITTDIFDDEKIRLIESLPDADSILVIWLKLLVQAGKTSDGGFVRLNETRPYTDEMLSTLFNRPLNTIRLALNTFVEFDMIEIQEDQSIYIPNFQKHQNMETMDHVRALNRARVAKHRLLKRGNGNCNDDVTLQVTLCNGTETEEEKEIKKKKKKKKKNSDTHTVSQNKNYRDGQYGHMVQQ